MRFTVIVFLSFLFIKCNTAPKAGVNNCTDFKTGKFIINFKQGQTTFDIERHKESQTEYDRKTDTLASYQVKWTSDCEYELRRTYKMKKTVVDSTRKPLFDNGATPPFKVRIITSAKNFYVYEIQTAGAPIVYTDTAWVVK
jgi:hypothetical protein